jgi:phosphoglycolate phosphatase
VQAIVSDLDGTIIDSRRAIGSAIQAACMAVDVSIAKDADLDWAIGPRIEQSLARLVGKEQMRDARAAFRDEYRRTSPQLTELMPGAREALQMLRSRGCRLAVATYKPKVLAEMILKALGLRDLFEVVAGRFYEVEDMRSKSLIVDSAVKQLGVTRRDVVYVGDHTEDLLAARDLGLFFIRYGVHDWPGIVRVLDPQLPPSSHSQV